MYPWYSLKISQYIIINALARPVGGARSLSPLVPFFIPVAFRSASAPDVYSELWNDRGCGHVVPPYHQMAVICTTVRLI